MKKIKISFNALRWALLFGMVCAVFLSMAQFNVACDDLRTNVLRLHIIANSDETIDQDVKLKVRDSILQNSGDLFCNTVDMDEAIDIAQENIKKFEDTAKMVLKENGFDYSASARIGKSYFETREYEDFTLPAGEYESLIITLGKGNGKNWWCVIFPEICIPAAMDKASLSDTVTPKSSQIAEQPQRYKMRFKIVELYEDLKKLIK